MLIKLQYPDLGPEEVGLVVRVVDPRKPSPSHLEDSFASHTLSAVWLDLISSQSNRLLLSTYRSSRDLERLVAKLPFLFPFLLTDVKPLF